MRRWLFWHDGSPEPMRLADGIATRLSRALRARDYIQVRLRSRDFEATWDEVLLFFDAVLTQLMGALDQLARLLHAVYVMGTSDRPSWPDRRRKGWLEELTAADPRVGELVQPGQEVADAIDLVAEMRNHIHEAPLSDETPHAGDGAGVLVWGPGVVALPSDSIGATLAELSRAARGIGQVVRGGPAGRSSHRAGRWSVRREGHPRDDSGDRTRPRHRGPPTPQGSDARKIFFSLGASARRTRSRPGGSSA